MYTFITLGKNEHAARLKIQDGDKNLSFSEVFDLWKTSSSFIDFYTCKLLEVLGNSFFWEHPPLLQKDLDKDYELVIRKTNSYAKRVMDEQAFSEHFEIDNAIVNFDNLGRNARLIVPVKTKEGDIYKHLGSFLEGGDKEQIEGLFQTIAIQVESELKKGKQIWLNTAGLGVIWLHVRLDTRPKYYKTKQYKNPDFFSE
ncbi:DUF6940 family protein [Flammeovirga aprica]|uniref:Uncharacterized protein n=1 Tax=Flammeovirga aprica JL-4 TaxID=694437 RepID=A0A7X9P3Z2_9BACT|nr:hypothetical protein [Flammeovirga aprica]NME68217.1 hypothetical protein [Flammeovirga aprica JL-4]